ncbi:MAG: hypothetical protein IJW78_03905 [Clostridia bacterium]|nr:hypothetical protein [Clostridia bacterium]
MDKKRRRRFGDRKDGRRIRSIDPMSAIASYIMVERNTCSNLFEDAFSMENVDAFIKQQRAKGLKGFGVMHVLVAAYVRMVSAYPATNRFISGQKLFHRNNIEIALTIKKDMNLESPDTVIKVELTPDATSTDVYNAFTKEIESYRNEPGGDFDKTAKLFSFIPGVLLKFTVWLLKLLDYFGGLPKFLLKVSPFHAGLFITSMGSLGIPPIYHHLYDFGNCPLFIAFGAKEKVRELQMDGSVKEKKIIRYKVVMDERICDGYYYAAALKCFRRYMENPQGLELPPETVVEDID